jgi:hypothetical protein
MIEGGTSDEGFDRTPEGQAVATLLKRHAPPPPDVDRAREAVLARLAPPQGRIHYLTWVASAAGAAAAVMIAFVLLSQDPPRTTLPSTDAPVQPMQRGSADPRLVAVVRGPAGEGWRIDAGLKDGLRVGDQLFSAGGEYVVTAVGIFDARVKGSVAPTRGDRLSRALDNPALRRAAALEVIGGDPGGLYDFGAVFEVLPVMQAREHGFSDGRGLRVVETIAAVLRDFEAEPEPTLASRLGLLEGDIMVQVNGYPASDLNQLAEALEWSRKSRDVQATIIRGGRTIDLSSR